MAEVTRRVMTVLIAVFLIAVLSFSVYGQCLINAYEGQLIRLSPEAFDPDPEIGPAGMLLWSFGPPFNETGEWQTFKGQRGIFPFWVSVSDGELSDTEHACVELAPNNRDPILQPLDDIYITIGQHASISATCDDPDGDMVMLDFRFDGQSVAYIANAPVGTYTYDVTCTDGYGGVDFEAAHIHVLPQDAPIEPELETVYWNPGPEPELEDIEVKDEEPFTCPPGTIVVQQEAPFEEPVCPVEEIIVQHEPEQVCPVEEVIVQQEPVCPVEEVIVQPEPEQVCPVEEIIVIHEPAPVCVPEVVEVIIPAPQPYEVDVIMPPPPQPYAVEVVLPAKPIYDVEVRMECQQCPVCTTPDCPPCQCPAPEPEPVPVPEPEQESGCEKDGSRKSEINSVLNPCCS